MQFTAIAVMLALTSAVAASATPETSVNEVLQPRAAQACSTKGKCTCRSGSKQGQYCGYCDAVKYLGSDGYITNVSATPSLDMRALAVAWMSFLLGESLLCIVLCN